MDEDLELVFNDPDILESWIEDLRTEIDRRETELDTLREQLADYEGQLRDLK